jgi:putative ABC transport system ATP-binding protein
VAKAFEVFLSALGMEIDPAAVREAARSARGDISEHAALLEELSTRADSLGLRIFGLEASPEQLVRSPSRSFPLLAELPDGSTLVLEGAKGLRMRVRHGEHSSWLGAPSLAAKLGLAQPNRPFVFAAAEAALPWGISADHDDHHHGSPSDRVMSLLRLERSDAFTLLVYAVFIGLTTLAVPVAVQAMVNTLSFGTLIQPLVVLGLIVLGCLGLSGLLRALQTVVVERLQVRLFVRAATEFAHRLPRISIEAFHRVHPPERVNRFFDVITAQKAVAALATDGLLLVLQASMGMLLLAFYHPFLLAFAVLLLALVASIVFGLGRRGVSTAIDESALKYDIVAWLEGVARSPVAFRHNPELALERTDDLARRWIDARKKHFSVVFRQSVGALTLQAFASATLLVTGGLLVQQGELTIGQLVAAEIVVTMVVAGVAKLGKHLETYYDLATALEKIAGVTELDLERTGGARALSGRGPSRLDLVGVSWASPNGRVIHDGVNLCVEPSAKVAVLAAHGAGKSVLADLVYGLREPSSGTVLVDGIDLRELSLGELRRNVALVRDVEIFDGTIAENVTVGRVDVSLEDVHRALVAVGLADDVLRLRQGVRTELVAGGAPLSPGQATRLVLARALAARPRLIVIDSLLDELDTEGLELLEACLDAESDRTSLLVLTSLPHVAEWCDRLHRIEAPPRLSFVPSAPPVATFSRGAS